MLDVIQSTATVVSPAFTDTLHTFLSSLVQLAVLGLVGLVSYATKVGISHLKHEWQRTVAKKFVSYAEQRLLTNDDKFSYAKARLKEALPRLTEEDVDLIVEQAVVELKAGLSKKSKSN